MSREQEIMQKSNQPRTVASLKEDLMAMGVKETDTILVHSSLSAIGWVSGGPQAVVEALFATVNKGTLVMPTQSAGLSDPEHWQNPPVPHKSWIRTIRQTMPAFDPDLTPTRGMGQIVETFRAHRDVERSYHPICSFAAWGKDRDYIVRDHELSFGLGEGSPLKKLEELNAKVLLIGVGYDSNTCFHLAENRVKGFKRVTTAAPIMVDGERVWQDYREIDMDVERFPLIGERFEGTGNVRFGMIGSAPTRMFLLREAVSFAESELPQHLAKK
ncbi:AAC(3) family N-acetyltransferase [Paenalkalicoccus suaedae]|uniref:Aminoglycoside N(3)-acetyltransferase n=1 Tax=Paenalkalicoccus suaedae TaxID=2592382 RepID=A0A859FA12_9BACI|nr:AAC(3) family N-acetyltransferase [Paenalkalicoccus suaedae]QKS70063.1 AAC(3) family N-acetyltransferase [Paenalkalicoccus suaedae]